MPPAVLVTGSSGHIGRALAEHLAAAGCRVRGLDRQPGPATDLVGELQAMPLGPAMDGIDVVVHCASLHAPHVGRVDPSAFVDVNVTATARLLDGARVAGVSRFVFTSTTSVYGEALVDRNRAVWVDESLTPRPRDVYDTTKLAAEALVAEHHGPTLRTITLRVARCFPEPWPTAVVNRLSRGVDRRDVVSGLELAVHASIADHATLNLAGPRVFERSDVERLRTDPGPVIEARCPGLASTFERRGWTLPDTIDRVYVSDLAIETLGYRPVHGIEAALAGDGVGSRRG